MKTKGTETLGKCRDELSKIKVQSSRLTCKNYAYTIIMAHNTVA